MSKEIRCLHDLSDENVYKLYRLSKNLEKAVEAAKPTQAKLSVKTAGNLYETSLIFLRRQDPGKVEQFKMELVKISQELNSMKLFLIRHRH